MAAGRASKFVAMVGRYSYSIYLLHAFVVFMAADFINRKVLVIENTYLALLASLLSLVLFLPVAAISYQIIEAPFLKRRLMYTKPRQASAQSAESVSDEYLVRQAA